MRRRRDATPESVPPARRSDRRGGRAVGCIRIPGVSGRLYPHRTVARCRASAASRPADPRPAAARRHHVRRCAGTAWVHGCRTRPSTLLVQNGSSQSDLIGGAFSVLEFPNDRPHLADLPDWISRSLPGRPAVQGPVSVLRVKRWGVTATYRAGDRLVVVKDAHPPLFPHAAAVHRAVELACPDATARLLATESNSSWQRTIFGLLLG